MTAVLLQRKGGDGVGKTKRGKGTKWMVGSTAGVPLGDYFTLHPGGGQARREKRSRRSA